MSQAGTYRAVAPAYLCTVTCGSRLNTPANESPCTSSSGAGRRLVRVPQNEAGRGGSDASEENGRDGRARGASGAGEGEAGRRS